MTGKSIHFRISFYPPQSCRFIPTSQSVSQSASLPTLTPPGLTLTPRWCCSAQLCVSPGCDCRPLKTRLLPCTRPTYLPTYVASIPGHLQPFSHFFLQWKMHNFLVFIKWFWLCLDYFNRPDQEVIFVDILPWSNLLNLTVKNRKPQTPSSAVYSPRTHSHTHTHTHTHTRPTIHTFVGA